MTAEIVYSATSSQAGTFDFDEFHWVGYYQNAPESQRAAFGYNQTGDQITFSFQEGDINGDDNVDLTDAILALQVVASMGPAPVYSSADVNADGKIGTEEVIYILQKVSGLR